MVVAFEKENPAWQVIAAVNGDFFNTSTGEPESPMIQQGNMLKPSKLDDMNGRGMVGVDDVTNKVVYHTIGSAYQNAKYGTNMTFKSVYQVQVLGTHKTNAIQYSSLENSMDRGVWQVTVYGVTKSWT